MKIDKETLINLRDDACIVGYEVVYRSDWVSHGKYEYADLVFKYNDKFYCSTDGRTGSYYSEYYYKSEDWEDEVEVSEVAPVTKTITVYELIKEPQKDDTQTT